MINLWKSVAQWSPTSRRPSAPAPDLQSCTWRPASPACTRLSKPTGTPPVGYPVSSHTKCLASSKKRNFTLHKSELVKFLRNQMDTFFNSAKRIWMMTQRKFPLKQKSKRKWSACFNHLLPPVLPNSHPPTHTPSPTNHLENYLDFLWKEAIDCIFLLLVKFVLSFIYNWGNCIQSNR